MTPHVYRVADITGYAGDPARSQKADIRGMVHLRLLAQNR